MTEDIAPVSVTSDLSRRPAAPKVIEAHHEGIAMSWFAVLMCQVVLFSNGLAIAANHNAELSNDRFIIAVLDVLGLVRSEVVESFRFVSSSHLDAYLLLIAALLSVAIFYGLPFWRHYGELVALIVGVIGLLLLVGGALRIAFGRLSSEYSGWSILIWISTVGLGLFGSFRMFQTIGQAPADRSFRKVLLVGSALVAAFPIMLRLGYWRNPNFDVYPFRALKDIAPWWLYLNGALAVTLVIGWLMIRPPWRIRPAILLGAVLVAGSVVLSTSMVPDQVTELAFRHGLLTTNSVDGQAGNGGVCYQSLAGDAATISIVGDDCGSLAYKAQDVDWTVAMLGPLAGSYPVGSALDDNRVSSGPVVDAFESTVVSVERQGTDGPLVVVGRSITNPVEPSWTVACPNGVDVKADLSGGRFPPDDANNRVQRDFFGVSTYVAVKCDGNVQIFQPSDGARIGE